MPVRNAIVKRCESDTNTKLRLKYQPYYQNVTAANGVNIVVAGKPMVMMSSTSFTTS